MLELNRRFQADLPLSAAERAALRRWMRTDPVSFPSSAGTRRKRKKRRKRRLHRTSSRPSRGRAGRRQWQWYVLGWFFWCSSRCVPFYCRLARVVQTVQKVVQFLDQLFSARRCATTGAGFSPDCAALPVEIPQVLFLDEEVPWSSAAVPQLQFIDGRRHPCFCAVAVPYGPDCSENHKDSPVARRHGGRCSFRAGYTGSHVQVVGGTVVLPQFLLVEKIAVSFEVVDIPVVTQRPFPMVQPVWRTIEIPQLQFALGGQCSDYAGRAGSWLSPSLSWRRGFPLVQTVLRTFVVSICS